MEPLSPEFRKSLKRAHKGLQDEDIDRLEELTVRRTFVPPGEEGSQEARDLNSQIEELIRARMPRFRDVAREDAAARHSAREREAQRHSNVRIERKGGPESS